MIFTTQIDAQAFPEAWVNCDKRVLSLSGRVDASRPATTGESADRALKLDQGRTGDVRAIAAGTTNDEMAAIATQQSWTACSAEVAPNTAATSACR